MLKINQTENITNDLISYLKENQNFLKILNKEITNDTDYAIDYDYDYIIRYLEKYRKNVKRDLNSSTLHPKGKILIILSYNEPFVMSIIPVLNALVAGNVVEIKPSSKALDFFSHIWAISGIINKYQLKLNIYSGSKEELINVIHNMNAVYFFGGFNNATGIAKVCAENLVEFHPEIEASDFQIINISNIKDVDPESIKTTIHDSLLHSGQSCQRIQGIYINNDIYKSYKALLIATFYEMIKSGELSKYVPLNYQPKEILLNNFQSMISKENNIEIQKINGDFPYIISNINPNGELIKSAQFLPTLWLSSYSSQEDLLEWIHNRKFRLGLNILSDNKTFIDTIIESTNYSRYTINTKHSFVRYNEGWGGISPTGFNGYKSWIEHFSYPFTVIIE